MKPRITIVDYGMGNLHSVAKAFEAVDVDVHVTRASCDIDQAERLVVPGVGAFGDCRRRLEESGLLEPVAKAATDGRPFMGICLGLQILFDESEEFGQQKGLGRISGRVVRFPDSSTLKIPHMGWNHVDLTPAAQDHPLWKDIAQQTAFYFVHSYYAVPKKATVVAGRCSYGVDFTAAVLDGSVFATQFHPEKSQQAGLQVLKNFSVWRP